MVVLNFIFLYRFSLSQYEKSQKRECFASIIILPLGILQMVGPEHVLLIIRVGSSSPLHRSLSLILIPQLFVVHFFLVAEQVNCWKSGLVPSSNGLALSLEIASFHAQPLNSVFRKMYALQLNFEMYKRAGGKLCFAGRSRSAPALYIIRQQTWT